MRASKSPFHKPTYMFLIVFSNSIIVFENFIKLYAKINDFFGGTRCSGMPFGLKRRGWSCLTTLKTLYCSNLMKNHIRIIRHKTCLLKRRSDSRLSERHVAHILKHGQKIQFVKLHTFRLYSFINSLRMMMFVRLETSNGWIRCVEWGGSLNSSILCSCAR